MISMDGSENKAWTEVKKVLEKIAQMQQSSDELKEVWESNRQLLYEMKKIQPEMYEQVRAAFTARKQELIKEK